MIKKVLIKNKTKIIKKFPEYDSNKIYVRELYSGAILEYKQIGQKILGIMLTGGSGTLISYVDFNEVARCNKSAVIYILENHQNLASFILGSRDFPILKEIEEEVEVPLADDEVLVPSYLDKREIYALKTEDTVYLMVMLDFKYAFINIAKPWMTFNGSFNTIDELFKRADLHNYGGNDKLFNQIYQFDTAQEFLEWSLEQIKVKGE